MPNCASRGGHGPTQSLSSPPVRADRDQFRSENVPFAINVGFDAKDLDLTETALREWVRRADVDAGKAPPGGSRPKSATSSEKCSAGTSRRCSSRASRRPPILLFPRNDGLFRSDNDLARAAKVESLVTKSISGHLTDRMKDHYSTVSPLEQRESIGRVLGLVNVSERVTLMSRGLGLIDPLGWLCAFCSRRDYVPRRRPGGVHPDPSRNGGPHNQALRDILLAVRVLRQQGEPKPKISCNAMTDRRELEGTSASVDCSPERGRGDSFNGDVRGRP